MADETQTDPLETPIEAGSRMQERLSNRDARQEYEADIVVGDIDKYVAETDPESLPEAEQELENWQIPEDPLDNISGVDSGKPLVSVFSASNEAEAHIVNGVLQAAGIPSTLQDIGSPPMGGIFAAGEQSAAHILVPEGYVDDARRALADATTTADNAEL